jgi:hypothetical protein
MFHDRYKRRPAAPRLHPHRHFSAREVGTAPDPVQYSERSIFPPDWMTGSTTAASTVGVPGQDRRFREGVRRMSGFPRGPVMVAGSAIGFIGLLVPGVYGVSYDPPPGAGYPDAGDARLPG